MGMAATKAGWTIEQLAMLPDDGKRYEIIDGELFVTPAPAWRHQRAVLHLATRLDEYLRVDPIGSVIPAPADVDFDRRTVVEPDLLVVPLIEGRPPRDFTEAGRLLVAIEVLSPTTAARDRGLKRELYQRERVDEYWIVDLDARLIERWHPGEQRPEILRERLEWHPAGTTNRFALDITALFAALGDA